VRGAQSARQVLALAAGTALRVGGWVTRDTVADHVRPQHSARNTQQAHLRLELNQARRLHVEQRARHLARDDLHRV
jgi:hypothetical protein